MSATGRQTDLTQPGEQTEQRILIVAQPDPLGHSLAALLSALPQVSRVLQAGDSEAALRLAAANQPQLVILDFDSSDEGQLNLLNALYRQTPGVRCLVLAGDVHQKKIIESPHADAVLLKGTPATEIITLVERLLEDTPPA